MIKSVICEIKEESFDELTISFTDKNNKNRFKLPQKEPFPFTKPKDQTSSKRYKVKYSQKNEIFGIKIVRINQQSEEIETVFSIENNQNVVFSDYYTEISTSFSKGPFYGRKFFRNKFQSVKEE